MALYNKTIRFRFRFDRKILIVIFYYLTEDWIEYLPPVWVPEIKSHLKQKSNNLLARCYKSIVNNINIVVETILRYDKSYNWFTLLIVHVTNLAT